MNRLFKSYISIGFILLALASICQCSFAQNSDLANRKSLLTYLNNMNNYLDTVSEFSVIIHHIQFEDSRKKNYLYKSYGYFFKSKNNVHSKLLDIETFITDKFVLVIDSQQKTMIVKESPKKIEQINFFNYIQSAIGTVHAISKSIEPNGIVVFKLKFKDDYSEYKEIDIEFNTRNYLIKKVAIYMNLHEDLFESNESKSPLIEIVYDNWKLGVNNSASNFNWEKYLYKSNNNYFPKRDYANYRYLNQLNTK